MRRGCRIVLIALLLVAVGFGLYVSDYYRADGVAMACLEGDEGSRVKLVDGVFCVETQGSSDALVFYPGGKVQAEAYLPLMKRIAAEGIDCYLVKMPFNLAVFGMGRAAGVMAAHHHDRWVLAGHSLGGVMAAQWAADHPGELDGLALLAAYPVKKLPEGLPVAVLYGSEDGVLNRARLEKSTELLPPGAVVEQLPGGNHAYFGSYGKQKGDGTATISPEEQWAWTAERIARLFGE